MKDNLIAIPGTLAPVTLRHTDHISTGGEGSVFFKNEHIFKIYHDAKKAVAHGIEQKIEILRLIQDPGIVAPKGIVRDNNGNIIGIYMDRCQGEPLCKAYTTTWRNDNSMDYTDTEKLTNSMRSVVQAAHKHGAVLVDANETNWIMRDRIHAFVIDVDSWQLPGFRATAIMPSIRDYSRSDFTEESDWFSWAIVSFQLWTGIHPYRGTHPDFSRSALEARMKAKVSVFDRRIKLPPATRSITAIPLPLRLWYEDVFGGDERSPPPSASKSNTPILTTPIFKAVQTPSSKTCRSKVATLSAKILEAYPNFVVTRINSTYEITCLKDYQRIAGIESDTAEQVLTRTGALFDIQGALFLATIEHDHIKMSDALNPSISSTLPLSGSRFWQCGNRTFVVSEGISNGLIEIRVTIIGKKPVPLIYQAWPVSALSTDFYDGVFVQDCMGMPFIGVPVQTGLIQGRADFLMRYKISSGFARDAQNVFLSGTRRSDGEIVILRLSGNDTQGFHIDQEIILDTYETLNGAMTAGGIGSIFIKDELHIFKGKHSRIIYDHGLNHTDKLIPLNAGLGCYQDKSLYAITLN